MVYLWRQQISGWNNQSAVGTTSQPLKQQISGWNNKSVVGTRNRSIKASQHQKRGNFVRCIDEVKCFGDFDEKTA
jgi:hypothetical protein